jgi:hypothetical protein
MKGDPKSREGSSEVEGGRKSAEDPRGAGGSEGLRSKPCQLLAPLLKKFVGCSQLDSLRHAF